LALNLKIELGMPSWSILFRWFTLRLLLLLATLLAPGCGYSTYNIPPAELQRLTQLPPSQRGMHVRVFTPGLGPATTPTPAVAASPAIPPLAVQPAPPAPEAVVNGELVDGSLPAGEVYLHEPESPAPPVLLSVDITPPAFVPVPPVRPRTAPTRFPPPAFARPSMRPPIAGHGVAPRAVPHLPPSASPRAVSVGHAGGGHVGGLHGSPHAGGGGGGGGAAVGALVGVIALIALVAIVAESSEPTPFDGWIRTFPEHPVKLTYTSGLQRQLRLCDLKSADIAGVSSAVLQDIDGSIEHLESAPSNAPAARPPERTWTAHANVL
jgi:hypothetical protein